MERQQGTGVHFAEGQVTRLRREMKVVLGADELSPFLGQLERLQRGGSPEPTRITSVYFDRPGHPLAARAERTPHDCLKVRTKEYFPDLCADGQARVVLEAKRERSGLTQKRRVWMPREQLARVIEDGGRGVARLITGGTMRPVLAVSYLRHVYQSEESWRVTVDREIEFFEVTPALALSVHRLTRARLGAPVARESRVVIELKFMGEAVPAWLEDLARRRSARFSKFAEGMRRLRQLAAGGAQGG